MTGTGLVSGAGGSIGTLYGRCVDASSTLTLGEITAGNIAPQTSALGSGQALDITPSYYTVHMWLRLT